MRSCLQFLFKVQSNVAQLLLDISNDFTLGSGGEGISALHQVLDQEIGEVATSEIETENGVRQGETFIDGDRVGDTITGVKHDTSGTTRSVERENSMDGDVEGGCIERLEHDLGHLLSVGFGVEGSFSEENGVLFGCDTKFVIESVMPDLLHIVPVGDDTVLDGVFQGKDTTL